MTGGMSIAGLVIKMKKITVTIEEDQDKAITNLQIKKAQSGNILNYSEALRLIIDEGLKKF